MNLLEIILPLSMSLICAGVLTDEIIGESLDNKTQMEQKGSFAILFMMIAAIIIGCFNGMNIYHFVVIVLVSLIEYAALRLAVFYCKSW